MKRPINEEAASQLRHRSCARRPFGALDRLLTAPEAAESCRNLPAESRHPAAAAYPTALGTGPVPWEPVLGSSERYLPEA